MKRSTARVALPQSKLAGTVTDGAGCAVEGDAAPDSAKAAERSKSPGRSADLLVMDDDPWIVAKVLLTDRERKASAILILSFEEDGALINAHPGPASDGESPTAPRRQPVKAESARIALDTVELAQATLADAAADIDRHCPATVARHLRHHDG